MSSFISLQERIVNEIESTYISIATYKNNAKDRVEIIEHKLKTLKMMLAKVDAGNHGWCEKCNEPILINQFSIKPTNTFCENCAN